MNRVAEPFQSLLNDIREATQTLANCSALGPLQKNGTRMSNDPYDMTVAEERAQQVDEQIDRLLAENDRLLSIIVDLKQALGFIADNCKDPWLEDVASAAIAQAAKETSP